LPASKRRILFDCGQDFIVGSARVDQPQASYGNGSQEDIAVCEIALREDANIHRIAVASQSSPAEWVRERSATRSPHNV